MGFGVGRKVEKYAAGYDTVLRPCVNTTFRARVRADYVFFFDLQRDQVRAMRRLDEESLRRCRKSQSLGAKTRIAVSAGSMSERPVGRRT